MRLQLEQLEYQQQAVNAVISVFKGQQRNTFDNATVDGIRQNFCSLSDEELKSNIKKTSLENGIAKETAQLDKPQDLCVEMETGTGKTLVYIKTIYELYRQYGFTKFIILVPSVAIREGVLKTFDLFKEQLEAIYNEAPAVFEYEGKRLAKVNNFVEEQHPQIMVMTLQSFNSEMRILNQSQRENLFYNLPYIDAIAQTRPIVIMDEPQEGMDTENSQKRIESLNPLCRIRYSATHKVMKNLIYRLTPYQSYKQGLVKKIEVLTVSEKNDEASMKIELVRVDVQAGKSPTAVFRAWHQTASGFQFKNTKKLKDHDSLHKATGNIIYKDYTIESIAKPIRGKPLAHFTNGAVLLEGEKAKDLSVIFGEQLYWLIDTHFLKKERLKKQGIKCLSLIFIDRVANYMTPEGIIKTAFTQQYKKVCRERGWKEPGSQEIEACQGYYFAQTGKGDYTDNQKSMLGNKELFDLILKDKEQLLDLENPVEFIFSHSALGVGWDNPNVFNIATLNQSYSEIKKRQEIGRGLRISVDQQGQRRYDNAKTPEGQEINLLTVIPNESYETFVAQYQSEIEEVYGSSEAGAETRGRHKGGSLTEKRITRNDTLFNSPSFREFWKRLARKTEFLVRFDDDRLVELSIAAINQIKIPEQQLQVTLGRIDDISQKEGIITGNYRSDSRKTSGNFAPLDIIKELGDSTSLAQTAVIRIIKGISNKRELIKNPPLFVHEAAVLIRKIELDEMLRALSYRLTGESFDLDEFQQLIVKHTDKVEPTPKKGIYDHIIWDSEQEQRFARVADRDHEVVCFLKLPGFYKIPTPAGTYNPDFGIVMKRRKIRDDGEEEFYFVFETKGINNLRACIKFALWVVTFPRRKSLR